MKRWMRFRFLAAALAVAAVVVSFSPASATTWNYDFGTTTGTTTGTSTTFLPAPPTNGGTARVRVGTGGGSFQLLNPGTTSLGADSELLMVAPTSTSVNKFSIYDYTPATTAYQLSFSTVLSGTSGTWTLAIGNGASYSDNNNQSSAQIAMSLRFTMTTSGVTSEYLQTSSTYSTTGLTTSGIVKNSVLDFKIFGNDDVANTNYQLAGTTYTLNANSWDLWLGSSKIATGIAQNGSWTGANVDSFMFIGASAVANSATMSLDNIVYANELPTAPLDAVYWAPQAGGGGSGAWTSAGTTWATSAGTQGALAQGSGTLIFGNAAGTVTVSDTVAAAAGMRLSTSGYLFSSGTISLAGATSGSNTITVDPSVSGTIDSILAGSAGMTKAGAGTLSLGGANTLTGTVAVGAGMLATTTSGVIADAAIVDVSSGATFQLGGSDTVAAVIGSGTVDVQANTLTANTTVAGTFAGVLAGTGGLTKTGAATYTLSGSNTYSGATTITEGILATRGAERVSNSSAVSVASGAVFQLGGAETVGSLAGSGTVAIGLNALSVGAAGTSTTFDGSIQGDGGTFTKVGAGRLTLTGNNSYNAATTVAGGTLALSGAGAIASTTIVVGSGATFDVSAVTGGYALSSGKTLSGVGSVVGPMTVGNGSTIAPGPTAGAVGTLITSDLTLAAGGTYAFNIADVTTGAGIGWDLLSAGTVTLPGSAFTIDVSGAATGFSSAVSQSWKILAAQAFNGTFDSDNFALVLSSFPSLGGGSLAITNTGTDGTGLYLAFTAAANLQWLGGSGGSGTWSATGGTDWSGGTWDPAQPGVFAGTAGAVTVEGVTAEKGLSFDVGGYVLTGGTLSLTGTSLAANTIATVSGTTTINTVLAGSAGLGKSGGGTLLLGGANTLTGTIDVGAGTVATTAAGAIADGADVAISSGAVFALGTSETIGSVTGSGTVNLGANTLVTGANDASTTLAGVIEGSGGLTKAGAGTFTLSGANTYTGVTTITGGTLATASANLIADASAVAIDPAGTLVLGGNETIASLAGLGAVILGGNTLTTGDGSSTTFSGAAAGSGGMTKVGAGTFTLSGVNTYGGTTRVEAGTLALGANDVLSGSTTIHVAGGTFDVASFSDTAGSLTLSTGAVVGTGTLTAATYALAGGTVSGNLGGGSLTATGNLSLVGTAAATSIDLVSGTLALGSAGRLTGNAALTGSSGAVLALGGHESLSGLSGASTMNLGSATLTVDTAISTTFSGVLSGSSGGFVKTGVGTLTLNNTGNTVGTITVSQGTLATSGFSMIDNAANVTIDAAGTLSIGNSDGIGSIAGAGSLVIVAGTATLGGGNASTSFTGAISGAGSITKIGTGTFTLGGPNSYAGATRANVGTLALGASNVVPDGSDLFIASGAAIDMAGFSDTVNTFTNNSGAISGVGSVLTAGTYTLAGGTTSVALGAGTLVGSGNASLVGTSAASLVNATSGTLTLASAGRFTAAPTINGASTGRIVLGGDETVAGLSGAPRVEITTGTLTVNAGVNSTHTGIVSGAGSLLKQGAGTLTLAGGNTFSGPTVISAGTLATTGAAGISSNVTIAPGAALALGGNQTVSTIAGTGLVSINAGTLTVDTASTEAIAAELSGSGGFAKAGSGDVVVNGNNAGYAGPVSVAAGTLKAATATSLGTGTIALGGGTLTAASGLTIANDLAIGSSAPATWYSQNFNGIGSSLPTGWTTGTGATTSTLGSTLAFTTTAVDWVNTTASFKNYASATGLSSTATFGEQSASPDRALGVRPSGSYGDPGAAFTYGFSTTGKTIDTLSIDMMMLDVEGRVTDWSLQYGIGASPSSFTTLGTWTTPETFGTTTLTFSGTAVSGLSNQTDAVFRVVALAQSTGSGSRDSIGIDNFRIDTFEIVASTAAIGATEAGAVQFTGDIGMISTSTATLTAVAGGTATFAGAISGGQGSLSKTGAGIAILTGNNSYGGSTTVDAGGLVISGTHTGTGLVSAANAAWIGGAGSLAGDLTLAAGAGLVFDPLTTLRVGGALTLDNSFGVANLMNADGSAIDWGSIAEGTYTLVDTTSTFDTIQNFGAANALAIGGGRSAYFQNGSLELVVVPEPSAVALAGLGVALAGYAARKRRRHG